MKLLLANLFSILCISGAFYLMLQGKDGWGWLMLISLFGLHTYSSKSKETEKENEK